MPHVVLFHSALGLRPSVLEFARVLREHGHVVHVPDLYRGKVFDTVASGAAERDAIGVRELMRRGRAAAEHVPADCCYAGFSLGAAVSQLLGLTRPGSRGIVLMHGVLPLESFGVHEWPPSLRAQLHYAEDDALANPWIAEALAQSLPSRLFEVHRYPGSGHLFADADLPEYDQRLAQMMQERVLAFLSS